MFPCCSRTLVLLTTLTLLFSLLVVYGDGRNEGEPPHREKPLIFFAVLARNAAHLLRNYFGYIEALHYPKERIAVG